MSKDHEEVYQKRDLILAKMDANLDHVVEWTKGHDVKDDVRFAEVNKKLLWGGIAIVIIALHHVSTFLCLTDDRI